jgi:beta-glucosidase
MDIKRRGFALWYAEGVRLSDLWFFNADMKRVVEPGTFTIFAGPDGAVLKKTTLTVA